MQKLLKFKAKLPLFLLLTLLVGSVLWLYTNNYLTQSKATQPKVNITMVPTSATWGLTDSYRVTFLVKPADVGNKMSGIDLTFVATGNLSIVSADAPFTFPGGDTSLFTQVNKVISPGNARLSYVITRSQADLPDAVQFNLMVKGTAAGTGTLKVDATTSQIVGNITGFAYDLGTPATGTYTFSNTAPSSTPTAIPSVSPTARPSVSPSISATPTTRPSVSPSVSPTLVPSITASPTTRPSTSPSPSISATPTTKPSVSPSVTQPAGNVTLNMKLKFQGIVRKPVSGDTYLTKVTLVNLGKSYNSGSNDVTFTSDDQGVWTGTTTFNAPVSGGYYILVKGPKHVQKKICEPNPVETVPGSYRCGAGNITLAAGANTLDFSPIYQLVGDLPDQDGIVDSYDVAFLRLNLGKDDAKSLSIGDVNLDGRVDTQDYSLVIASLSIKKDEE